METFRLLKVKLVMALLGQSSLAIKEIADPCGLEVWRLALRRCMENPPRKRGSCCSNKKRLCLTRCHRIPPRGFIGEPSMQAIHT
jgi:hypothetical protein